MGFLEKEKDIINRLEETDYMPFDGDRNRALDLVAGQMENIMQYVYAVIEGQNAALIQRNTEPEAAGKDEKREDALTVAAESIEQMDRLSEKLGLGPFSGIDTKDRDAVKDCICRFMKEIYAAGIGKA